MKIPLQLICAFIFTATCFFLAVSASAAPVVWYLDGVVRSDGGTVSGSFTFDADTAIYSAINIVATSGSSVLPGESYGAAQAGSSAIDLYTFPSPIPADLTGEVGLFLGFPAALTNSGGTVTLTATSAIFECTNAVCDSTLTPIDLAGQITTNPPVATAVSTWPMYGLILSIVGVFSVAARRFSRV